MKVRSRFAFFRDKLQVFFLGLLLGLVLGGGFFLLKLDDYVKQLSFYKSLTEKNDKNDLDVPDVKIDSQKPKAKPHKKEIRISDSTDPATEKIAIHNDTAKSPYVYVGNNSDGNIVVREDEMLGEQAYPIVSFENKKTTDTAAQKGNVTESVTPESLDIEFWVSPLNYHGYKFSRNKLVLFGYSQSDLVSVMKLDNVTFLKCLTGVFKLDPSADFRQMDRVTDESLLAKLK